MKLFCIHRDQSPAQYTFEKYNEEIVWSVFTAMTMKVRWVYHYYGYSRKPRTLYLAHGDTGDLITKVDRYTFFDQL